MMGMRRGRECTNGDSVDDGDEKRERVQTGTVWMMGMRRGRECTNGDSVDDGDEKRERVYKQGQCG